jgi:RNA polymerase sigma factor (sigma-70 family)
MAAETMLAQRRATGWPEESIDLRDRHRQELLDRSRPMAASILGLLGAMTEEQGCQETASAEGEGMTAWESMETRAEREPPADEEEDLERLETSIAWHQMVEHLHPQLRRVIEMRYFLGLPRREVARRLGLAPRQVSYLQRCALRQLRVDALAA